MMGRNYNKTDNAYIIHILNMMFYNIEDQSIQPHTLSRCLKLPSALHCHTWPQNIFNRTREAKGMKPKWAILKKNTQKEKRS